MSTTIFPRINLLRDFGSRLKQRIDNGRVYFGSFIEKIVAQYATLDLRFADSKSLTDAVSGQNLIDFTRASSGTYVGSDGLIATALTDVPRFDHDPETGESLGLLIEEQRTNLLLNSATLATQDVTVTAVAHTLSFYGTGTVTLSGTHSATVVGTGAYPTRTTLTFTPTAGTLTVTVSGTVQYANLEAGSFATSWIPTAGTTVTRSADVASITGSNFSSWYNASEGTVFSDSSIIKSQTQTQFVYEFSGGSAATSLRQPHLTANQFRGTYNGVFSSAPGTGDSLAAGVTRAAVAFESSTGRLQVGNSGVDITAPSGNTHSQVFIGSTGGANNLNGRISRLCFFDRRLPNATLQAITK